MTTKPTFIHPLHTLVRSVYPLRIGITSVPAGQRGTVVQHRTVLGIPFHVVRFDSAPHESLPMREEEIERETVSEEDQHKE